MRETIGYRFHPTDGEIVEHFLENKNRGRGSILRGPIREVNVYDFEPWAFPWENNIVLYFFTRLEPMSFRTNRTNRSTVTGSWRATGNDRKIKVRGTVVGFKKTLVFYRRCAGRRPEKTEYIMHEYRALPRSQHQMDFVFCKIKKKEGHRDRVGTSGGAGEQVTPLTPQEGVNMQLQGNLKPDASEPPNELENDGNVTDLSEQFPERSLKGGGFESSASVNGDNSFTQAPPQSGNGSPFQESLEFFFDGPIDNNLPETSLWGDDGTFLDGFQTPNGARSSHGPFGIHLANDALLDLDILEGLGDPNQWSNEFANASENGISSGTEMHTSPHVHTRTRAVQATYETDSETDESVNSGEGGAAESDSNGDLPAASGITDSENEGELIDHEEEESGPNLVVESLASSLYCLVTRPLSSLSFEKPIRVFHAVVLLCFNFLRGRR